MSGLKHKTDFRGNHTWGCAYCDKLFYGKYYMDRHVLAHYERFFTLKFGKRPLWISDGYQWKLSEALEGGLEKHIHKKRLWYEKQIKNKKLTTEFRKFNMFELLGK